MSLVNINQINIIDSTTVPALSGAIPIALSGDDNIWSTNHDGAIIVPRGTTAQQPTPLNGQIRYNTDNNRLEAVENGSWASVVTLDSFAVVDDTSPQLGGNLDVNGFEIVSTSNGDIFITPDGAGNIVLDGLIWPSADGTSGQVLQTDGSGNLSFINVITDLVGDISPQLGGDLDFNNFNIIDPNGNEILVFNEQASAVNEIWIRNAPTSNGPSILARGDDTNIDLFLEPKGTGTVFIGSASTTTSISAEGGASDVDLNLSPKGNGSINLTNASVGGGSTIQAILTATDTLDFPSISAGTQAELTITVTGAVVGDAVFLGLPSSPASGIVFNAYVSAADTVTVRALNITGSPVDPVSDTYRVTVFSY